MIYYIGLLFAVLIVMFSFDDIIWDIYYFFIKLLKKEKVDEISMDSLEKVTPKLMAMIIAAYNEESVLEAVIENLIASQEYPMSMYHIFLGVYPNDPKTREIALKLDKKYPNVHAITHVLEGPSSKADNINNVIKNIFKFEQENNQRFNGIIIHDSEDIVHPYELLLENYLFKTKSAIQIPVFPLQEKPQFNNILKNMVTGTYADEFAENHVKSLTARNAINAFVPSAGTGFAIRRDVLDSFDGSNVFPVGSLTEDFKLSLQLKEKGYDIYYPLESVVRINYLGEEKKEYIATRSMFPRNYRAAVKQKTRWIYGITMQSFKLRDVITSPNLNIQSKYTLYKDYKSKFSNLLILPAYLIFIYFLISIFTNIPIMYPIGSLSWYIMLILTILMLQRQVMRFWSVSKVYGFKSATISSLLPPILPLRMVVGNIINLHATINAWKIKFVGVREKRSNKKVKPKWSKTDHEFLDKTILKRFKRTLGDDLLKKELISVEDLSRAIKVSKEKNLLLGEVLTKGSLVCENDVIQSIAVINHRQFINKPLGGFPHRNKENYNYKKLNDLNIIPLFEEEDSIVVVTTVNTNISKIKDYFKKDVIIVYTTEAILKSCQNGEVFNNQIEANFYIIEKLIHKKIISPRQGIIAMRYTGDYDCVKDTLFKMGFLQ